MSVQEPQPKPQPETETEQEQKRNGIYETNIYDTNIYDTMRIGKIATNIGKNATNTGGNGTNNGGDGTGLATALIAATPAILAVGAAGATAYGTYKTGQFFHRRDKGLKKGVNCKQTLSGLKCTKYVNGPLKTKTYHVCECAGKTRKEKRECKKCSNLKAIIDNIIQLKNKNPSLIDPSFNLNLIDPSLNIHIEDPNFTEQALKLVSELELERGASVGGNFIRKQTKRKLKSFRKQTKRNLKSLRKQTKRKLKSLRKQTKRKLKNKLKSKKQKRGKNNEKKSKK